MTFPAPNQSMVFIRLRLIFQRHTSGRSRQCLLPFWRTVVVTYSLLLVRLAAKGSQQLSHWYDIVTIDLKQADPGAIMVKFAIFSTDCAISCDTPERFFYLEKKCSVSTQTKSQYDRPSPEIPHESHANLWVPVRIYDNLFISIKPRGPRAYGLLPRLWLLVRSY